MNEQISKQAQQCADENRPGSFVKYDPEWFAFYNKKFAELILAKCTNLLWDESERLYAYSSECDNMRDSDEAQVVAEKCVDLITMIDQHFGFES